MSTQYAPPPAIAEPVPPDALSRRHCTVAGDPSAVVVGYTVLARHSPCLDHLPPSDAPPGWSVTTDGCESCATDQRTVLLHLVPRETVLGLHYTAGTMTVPDDLVGQTLACARSRLRELELAYIQTLLDRPN